jgi:3D (Asp-Asp-Asp) domain-containing protein
MRKVYVCSLIFAVALSTFPNAANSIKEENTHKSFNHVSISHVVKPPFKFPIIVHDPVVAEPTVQIDEQIQDTKQIKETETYLITAYTAGYESTQKKKGEKGYGLTASGATVQEGRTIACDRSIPFGTEFYIDGIGIRVCEDRGGKIKGKHIDLYMNDLKKAKEFGVQHLEVRMIKEGEF